MSNVALQVPRWCVVALAAAAVLLTLYVALWDVSYAYLVDFDTRFWFVGGVAWWEGTSPYDHAAFTEIWSRDFEPRIVEDAAFVYPGTILPLALGLGALDWDVARIAMRVLNVLAYGGTLLILRDLLAPRTLAPAVRSVRLLCVALAAALPAAALTITQGQLSLLVALGVCLTWWGLERERTLGVAAGLVLASLKLQASLPILVFLACRHADRRLLRAAVWSVALGAAVLLWTTPAELVADLRTSFAAHAQQEFNRLTNYDSLPALAARLGGARALLWAGVLSALALGCRLGCAARRSDDERTRLRLLQIVVALTAALMPVHRYDLTIDVLLLATAWAVGSRWRAVCLVALVLAHGRSFWLARHLRHRLGIDAGALDFYAATSSVLAGLVLALLLWFAWQDRRRTEVTPAAA